MRCLRCIGDTTMDMELELESGQNCARTKTNPTGLAPSIPEDLYHLIKKAVSVRKHLERNRGDKDAKLYVDPQLIFLYAKTNDTSRMILIESRIHRLARYYIKKQQLPPTFKYEAATASTLVA
jgi:small subunit ribosomal protein S13e